MLNGGSFLVLFASSKSNRVQVNSYRMKVNGNRVQVNSKSMKVLGKSMKVGYRMKVVNSRIKVPLYPCESRFFIAKKIRGGLHFRLYMRRGIKIQYEGVYNLERIWKEEI